MSHEFHEIEGDSSLFSLLFSLCDVNDVEMFIFLCNRNAKWKAHRQFPSRQTTLEREKRKKQQQQEDEYGISDCVCVCVCVRVCLMSKACKKADSDQNMSINSIKINMSYKRFSEALYNFHDIRGGIVMDVHYAHIRTLLWCIDKTMMMMLLMIFMPDIMC